MNDIFFSSFHSIKFSLRSSYIKIILLLISLMPHNNTFAYQMFAGNGGPSYKIKSDSEGRLRLGQNDSLNLVTWVPNKDDRENFMLADSSRNNEESKCLTANIYQNLDIYDDVNPERAVHMTRCENSFNKLSQLWTAEQGEYPDERFFRLKQFFFFSF